MGTDCEAFLGVTISSSATATASLDVYPADGNYLTRWKNSAGTDYAYVDTTGIQIQSANSMRFADSDSSNYVAIKASNTVASDVTWTLPAADGTSGQVLSTNGNGNLSWASGSTPVWTVTNNSAISYTATANDAFITSNNASAQTIDLPTAVGITGKIYAIKRLGALSNTVIDPNSSETIDGSATYTLSAQYASVIIISDGSNWHIVAKN